MTNATHLGLDMHKDTIAVALLRRDDSVPDERTIPNTPEALRKLVRSSTKPLVACYEAGPTSYETHRLLSSLGVDCDVIAPTMTPRRAGARVQDRPHRRTRARTP
jgi:transposase